MGDRTVVDLACYLIAPQMRINAKKNLLGSRRFWDVVIARLLGECRVLPTPFLFARPANSPA